MSVVVLTDAGPRREAKTIAWGLPEDRFAYRDGMITKAEVRAVALGKLALRQRGVLWDVGAGSGSVAIEAARLAPGLQVFAVEHDRESVDRIRANAIAHDVCVHVVHGRAPEALVSLPDPDRVFVGGGGLDVLDAALARLARDGVVVANFALLDRAVAAWQRLGNLVEVSVSRGVTTGDDHVRLASENPVFVCWGPS
jgi:precorrin-6Y C5,15-methyltransferase (decarboxylating)